MLLILNTFLENFYKISVLGVFGSSIWSVKKYLFVCFGFFHDSRRKLLLIICKNYTEFPRFLQLPSCKINWAIYLFIHLVFFFFFFFHFLETSMASKRKFGKFFNQDWRVWNWKRLKIRNSIQMECLWVVSILCPVSFSVWWKMKDKKS